MRLRKTVVVDKPLDTVFGYLSDFTTTTESGSGQVAQFRSGSQPAPAVHSADARRPRARSGLLAVMASPLVPSRPR